jgi:hypothetical protein
MELFNNKADFTDRPEVMKLLQGLEEAHRDQDELKASILLTKLKQLNITVESDSKEALQ